MAPSSTLTSSSATLSLPLRSSAIRSGASHPWRDCGVFVEHPFSQLRKYPVYGGGIASFHIIGGFEQSGPIQDRFFGKGEQLEQRAVEGQEVFFYKLVPCLDIVFNGKPEERADSVVCVEGDPVSVGSQNKEGVQEQFVMAKVCKKTVPQKTMLYECEAARNFSNTFRA